MTAKAKPIPDGHHTVTPYLVIKNAGKAIEFYKEAFGAVECVRLPTPDGKVMHAEIKIGDSPVMLCDECPDYKSLGPESLGGTAVSIVLYVEDVDTVVNRAITAGATVLMPVGDQFWGDRMGTIADPFGHKWSIATHKEDVTPEEIQVRAKECFGAK